jgi:predicted acyl esterase
MLLDIFSDIYAGFLFNLKGMINTNLVLTAGARVIFVFFFLLDHFTLVKGKNTPPSIAETRKMRGVDWAWFFTKEAMLICLGFLHALLMIIVLGYSLMLAGSHVVACARRSRFKVNLVFAWIIAGLVKFAVPVIGLLAAVIFIVLGTNGATANNLLIGASTAIIAFSGRSIAAFMLKRSHGRDGTPETAFKSAKRAISVAVPRSAKIVVLAAIIIAPVSFYFYLDATASVEYWTETITTTDGVHLATDIYRLRSANSPQPVLLMRTPYNKGDITTSGKSAYPLLQAGFTVVYQDQRGRYASDGKFLPFVDDYKDGAQTVSWIKNQPWCNGKIASWGGSAGAINQYCYADEPTGALKFQSLIVGSPEFYDHMVFQGGAFRKGMIETWLNAINDSNNPQRPTEYNDATALYIAHPEKDAAWNSTSLSMNNRYVNVHASAFHMGGWYDIFSQGTIDGFVGYNYLGGAGAADKQRLVMGPIGHGGFGELVDAFNGASTLRFPAADESGHAGWESEMRNAAIFGTSINWSAPSVAYYLMGDVDTPTATANKWHYASEWPVSHVNTTYYMHGNTTLSTTVAASNQTNSYIYDPASPVLTKGGNNLNQIASLEAGSNGSNGYLGDPDLSRVEQFEGVGPYDQQQAGNLGRSDVLVFETTTLASPISVVGRITVNLWVSSNCTDTAFTAMLMDQYPDGRSYNVLDGIQVMRYREGSDHVAATMVDGMYYRISIDLWSTAWQFNTGHKISVAISSSNYPRFERHPNTSAAFTNNPSGFVVANNTVLCGAGMFNASIVLPTVTY